MGKTSNPCLRLRENYFFIAASSFFRDLICYDFCWWWFSSHNALFSNSLAAVHQRIDPLNPHRSHGPISHLAPPRWWRSKNCAIKVNESRSGLQRPSSRWRHNQWTSMNKDGGPAVRCHHPYTQCNRCSVAVVSTGARFYQYFTLLPCGATRPGCWINFETLYTTIQALTAVYLTLKF